MANIDLAAYFKGGKYGSNTLSGDKGGHSDETILYPRLFQMPSER